MEVRPQSHVDTPEWQSFEARMLARRAERRAQAARVRRERLARAAVMVVLFVVAGSIGFGATWLWQQPIALTVTAPVPPSSIALRINDGALPGPAVDADLVPVVATALPSDVAVIVDEGAPIADAGPSPARESDRGTTEQAFRSEAAPNVVTERPAPTPRTVSAPVAIEPPSSPVTLVPGTRENPTSNEPMAIGTVGSMKPMPSVAPPPAIPARSNVTSAPGGTVGTMRTAPDSRVQIRSVLERYRIAYERLDAAAAGLVWPAVDRRALARAFESLQSQQIDFRECHILTATATAHATCSGRARAVPKIGRGGVTEADRTWEFSLVQKGNDWQIAKATVR